MSLLRMGARVSVLVLGAALWMTGCSSSLDTAAESAKEIIIFVDFSESIRTTSRDLIEKEFVESILPSLGPGDRILVAPINEKTFTDFHPLMEATFPSRPVFNGFTDNILNYNRAVKLVDAEVERLREELQAQVPGMLDLGGSAQKTDIFSSLLMAEKLFDRGSRRKVLILMSDMIVDYGPYRFDKIQWSREKNEELLWEIRDKGLIPDLSGVCVYVSGVSARSAETAGHISDFWQIYFKRTQADLDPSRYAHVLLHWPPSKSCSWSNGGSRPDPGT